MEPKLLDVKLLEGIVQLGAKPGNSVIQEGEIIFFVI